MTLADRLRSALAAAPAQPLLTGDDSAPRGEQLAPAAVLIAVTDRPQPGVILTVRHADMRTHAGQVAFPGGRIDQGEDAAAAAIREADEELGLPPSAVVPVALLDTYRTVTGFSISPLLAAIPPDLALAPHEREVADWFEAPLAFVLDPANHQRHSALFAGRERHYYSIAWQEREIWGATAAMLVNLSRRLQWG